MINRIYPKLIFLFMLFILIENAQGQSLNRPLHKRSITSSRYYSKRALWNQTALSYSLLGNVAERNQTSLQSVRKVLRDSFQEWQNNSCFNFIEVTPSLTADIKIIFTNDKSNKNYYHKSCERRFRGTAAHAFFRYHKKYPANIHINNEIFWMESKSPSGSISLKTVLLHEIGHVLGLFHSDDHNSVMYQYIFTNTVKQVTFKDKNEIFFMYKSLCNRKRKIK